MMTKISVVGLGKLGACLAATFAHRGFTVAGVDIDTRAVARLNQGLAPVCEPGLDEMIAANRSRLWATQEHEKAVAASDLTFILVATPSDASGGFALDYAAAAAQAVGRAIRRKPGYHLVAVQSTVMPGATEGSLLPLLEEASGKRCGRDFGLGYVPEFVALGSVLRNMLHPDLVVLGEHDERAGELLEDVYRRYVCNDPPIWRMGIINAELAKIALNAYITMKVSFANTLAEVCERLPGGDVDAVTQAVGSDPRIGSKYLKGGLSFAGPCFPRDTKSFARVLRQAGVAPLQIEATDHQNQTITPRILSAVGGALQAINGRRVAVLGLAFKPCTVYVENSPGMELAAGLASAGYDVLAYDPLAMDAARRLLGRRVRYAASVHECLQEADAVVITTPDPQFGALEAASFPARRPPMLVYDCWRLLRSKLAAASHVRYVPLGVGDGQPQPAPFNQLRGASLRESPVLVCSAPSQVVGAME